jgi:hypothetical protein
MHETSDFGVLRLAEVWTGRGHWRQDQSGGVHALNSSYARGNAVTAMWLARFDFLRADAGGAKLESTGETTAKGRRLDCLRATPPGGQTVELRFDAQSHLLAESFWLRPIDTLTVHYDDYRSVGGTMVPFKITEESEGSPDVTTVQHAEAVHADAREFVSPQPPNDFTIAGGVATVPIGFDGDVIVSAMLNGKGPFDFILDTGGHDILTPAAAKTLGLKGIGAGAAGGSGAQILTEQYTRVARMQIGGVTLNDQAFVILPLQFNTVERGAKPPLAGILGLELFERFQMSLNYRARTLSFRSLVSAPEGHGTPVAIRFTDDMPLFTATIDGITGDNGLDTGNSGALVVQGIWARANGLGETMRHGLETAGFGSGGMSRNWAVRADIGLAGLHFAHVAASYSEDKAGAFSSRTEAGNIGNQIYDNFTLTFDYARNKVWLDPAPGAPLPPVPYQRAGLSVFKQNPDGFTVAVVMPGGPAAEAGLATGDEIVAIDGAPVRELSGWDFRRMIRKAPGARIKIAYTRKAEKRTATITLRELLP